VNRDILCLYEEFLQSIYEVQSGLIGIRDSAIKDRESEKLDVVEPATQALLDEVKFNNLLLSQQGHDNIKTGLPPGANVILKPISAAGTKHDSQPARPRSFQPKDLCCHVVVPH
jgi:hypothetical protein